MYTCDRASLAADLLQGLHTRFCFANVLVCVYVTSGAHIGMLISIPCLSVSDSSFTKLISAEPAGEGLKKFRSSGLGLGVSFLGLRHLSV